MSSGDSPQARESLGLRVREMPREAGQEHYVLSPHRQSLAGPTRSKVNKAARLQPRPTALTSAGVPAIFKPQSLAVCLRERVTFLVFLTNVFGEKCEDVVEHLFRGGMCDVRVEPEFGVQPTVQIKFF